MAASRASQSQTQAQQRQSRFSMATGGPNRPSFGTTGNSDVTESGEGQPPPSKKDRLFKALSLIQVFLSDLLKPRDKRTLRPEDRAQARNYVVFLILMALAVYYVVSWLLRVIPMILGLFATFYVLFIVVKGRALTLEDVKSYLPEACHGAIDDVSNNVLRMTGRSASIAQQGSSS